jgi:two-component system, OmpR family, sensor kinase
MTALGLLGDRLGGRGCLTVVGGFVGGRGGVAGPGRDGPVKPLVVEPVDVGHGGELDVVEAPPGLELYREGGFRSEGQLDDMIRRMSQESTRMHDLVEDLLLLAQLDQRRPLRREQVDVGQLLRDATTDAQIVRPDRPITLDVPDEPIETVGDRYRLQQVIGAIVSNSLAYTETDVDLHLSARRAEDGAEITISDTGPGLQPDEAARAFDRFFRSEQSRARRTGGTGLGLAIARSIVEAHQGTITLDTAPGTGCRLLITLPLPGSVSGGNGAGGQGFE